MDKAMKILNEITAEKDKVIAIIEAKFPLYKTVFSELKRTTEGKYWLYVRLGNNDKPLKVKDFKSGFKKNSDLLKKIKHITNVVCLENTKAPSFERKTIALEGSNDTLKFSEIDPEKISEEDLL